jgi:hypothetical protein
MAIPPCGTFDYVTIVPSLASRANPWPVRLRIPVPMVDEHREHRHIVEDRLVGYSPTLTFVDAGLTPEPPKPSITKRVRPKVLRSRVTLTASGKEHATVASFAFHIDAALEQMLRPLDQIFMVRTGSGAFGMSVVRNGQLVFAVGALSAFSLGATVAVSIPGDLIAAAEGLFQERDPEFRLPEQPVQIVIDHVTRICCGGRFRLGAYNVWIEHGAGFYSDECLTISLTESCPDVAAIASAQLLDCPDQVEIVEWGRRTVTPS